MKNRVKDAHEKWNFKAFIQNNFCKYVKKEKGHADKHDLQNILLLNGNSQLSIYPYFLRYITSFTSLTVRGTSGNAAATRLGA
jgi:hypothetical protein